MIRDRVDDRALALFFGALALYGLYWRVDVFIVDTFAVGNALANLAAGSLEIETIHFGPSDGATPGMHQASGRRLARNYGHVFVALPLLLALKGVAAVASVRIVLAALWSLAIWACADRVAAVLGDDRVRVGGHVASVALFAVNLAFARSLPEYYLPLVALQLVTLAAAAGTATVAYRLVRLFHGPRAGTLAGVATALVGPVGFWAGIPKRHAVTGFLALLAVYCFAESRRRDDLRWRAGAYVPACLAAWVAAHEGFVLLVALGSVDLLTARRTALRDVAALASVVGVALLPFFLTNLVLGGNPLHPPRMWQNYQPVVEAAAQSSSGGTADVTERAAAGTVTTGGSGGSAGATSVVRPMIAALGEGWGMAVGLFGRSLESLDPQRLFHVFVRSGHIPGVDYAQTGGETVDLTLLETAPFVAALLGAPVVLGRRVRRRALPSLHAVLRARRDPARATDLLAVAICALYGLLYLDKLPLHSTITVRYLAPTVPLLVYGACRLGPVRRVADGELDTVFGLTAVGALLAVIAVPLAFAGSAPGAGTLMQVHALADLAVAALLAGWLVAAPDREDVGAVVVALALAAGGAFLLLSGLAYFADGRAFALPLARALNGLIPL